MPFTPRSAPWSDDGRVAPSVEDMQRIDDNLVDLDARVSTLEGTPAPSAYTDEQARDAVGAAMRSGGASTVTVDDAADTITVSSTDNVGTGGGGTADPAGFGVVFLDSFPGATDDEKLTAALAQCAAETYPKTIQLSARAYQFNVQRTPFPGMRIQGPQGYSNPERLGGTKMACRISLGMSGGWFHWAQSGSIFSVTLRDLSFVGGSQSSVLTNHASSGWYCLAMSGIYTSGLRSVIGTQPQRALLTGCSFTGDWEINNSYTGAMHMAGSDNTLWTDGMLIDSAVAYTSAGGSVGQHHIWCDYLEKSLIGPIYMTAEGPWGGIRITGQNYGQGTSNTGGPLTFAGMRVEGRNSGAPCYGALIRMEGGLAIIRDSWISYAMSNPAAMGHTPADAGVIHVEHGGLLVSGCTYARAGSVGESVPWIYSNTTDPVRVRDVFTTKGGAAFKPRVRRVQASGVSVDDSAVLV